MRITSDGKRRWAALIGMLLAVSALFSGFSLSWEYPTESSPTMPVGDITRFISANRGGLGFNLFLEGLTGILLVIFVAQVCGLLDAHERDGLAARVLFTGAVLAAATDLSVGLTTGMALVQFAPSSASTVISTLWMLNFADMVVIGFPLALMLGAATVVIWRTRVVARWMAVVSGLAAVLEIVAALATVIYPGGFQLPLWLVVWVLVVSAGLVIERHRGATPLGSPGAAAT